jgi:polyisoprenoid-binding protein YceI
MRARIPACLLGCVGLIVLWDGRVASNSARADEKPAAAAKSYDVDVEASHIWVKVGSATRLGHPHGVEGTLKSGKITFGGKGELVFDMTSFTADSQEARKRAGLEKKKVSASEAKKVTDAMRGNEVLDVEKYPTATFAIASISPADKQAVGAVGGYKLAGAFNLHGADKKLEIGARLEKTDKAGVLKLSGSFSILQTEYGITPYSALGGLAKVADELEITGEIVLKPSK